MLDDIERWQATCVYNFIEKRDVLEYISNQLINPEDLRSTQDENYTRSYKIESRKIKDAAETTERDFFFKMIPFPFPTKSTISASLATPFRRNSKKKSDAMRDFPLADSTVKSVDTLKSSSHRRSKTLPAALYTDVSSPNLSVKPAVQLTNYLKMRNGSMNVASTSDNVNPIYLESSSSCEPIVNIKGSKQTVKLASPNEKIDNAASRKASMDSSTKSLHNQGSSKNIFSQYAISISKLFTSHSSLKDMTSNDKLGTPLKSALFSEDELAFPRYDTCSDIVYQFSADSLTNASSQVLSKENVLHRDGSSKNAISTLKRIADKHHRMTTHTGPFLQGILFKRNETDTNGERANNRDWYRMWVILEDGELKMYIYEKKRIADYIFIKPNAPQPIPNDAAKSSLHGLHKTSSGDNVTRTMNRRLHSVSDLWSHSQGLKDESDSTHVSKKELKYRQSGSLSRLIKRRGKDDDQIIKHPPSLSQSNKMLSVSMNDLNVRVKTDSANQQAEQPEELKKV